MGRDSDMGRANAPYIVAAQASHLADLRNFRERDSCQTGESR